MFFLLLANTSIARDRVAFDSNRRQIEPSKHLSKSELLHGEKQLSRMIEDRPQMAAFIKKGDSVWTWVRNQFAGESIGSQIFWDASPPELPIDYVGRHFPPYGGRPGVIQLRQYDRFGKSVDGEHLWAAAIFEFYNIQNTPGFYKTYDAARRATITKEQFIHDVTELEFNAEKSAGLFYHSKWKPNLEHLKKCSNPQYWHAANASLSYEQWITQYQDHNSYPWDSWGKHYDELRADD